MNRWQRRDYQTRGGEGACQAAAMKHLTLTDGRADQFAEMDLNSNKLTRI